MPNWKNEHPDHRSAICVSVEDAMAVYLPDANHDVRMSTAEAWERNYQHSLDYYLVPNHPGNAGHHYLFYRYGDETWDCYCLGGTPTPRFRRGIEILLNKYRHYIPEAA